MTRQNIHHVAAVLVFALVAVTIAVSSVTAQEPIAGGAHSTASRSTP